MKFMFFIDLENYRQSLWSIKKDRTPLFDNSFKSIFDDINKRLGWEKYNPRFIRSYIYSGEYTKQLINNIKHFIKKNNKMTLQ